MRKIKLGIKSKFNLFLAITVIPFIIIAIVFAMLLSTNGDYEDFKQQVITINQDYQQLKQYEQSFLLNYQSDNTFFKTGENEYLRKFFLTQKELDRKFDIAMDDPTSKDLDLEDKLYIFKENAVSYNDLITLLSRKIYQRGSVQTGIIGEMERSYESAKLENAVSRDVLSSLKEDESQYLYRKDITFYNDFVTVFTKCFGGLTIDSQPVVSDDSLSVDSVEQVQRSFLPVTAVVSGKVKYLNDFKRYFTSLVKIDKEIGFNNEEGLLLDIQVEKNKLDEITQVVELIEEQQNILESQTRKLFLWTSLFILIAVIFTIRKLTKKFTLSITKLKEFIEPFSKGILPETLLKTDSSDELFEMAANLNAFAEGLKKTTRFATTIGSGKLDTEFTPLSEHDVLGNSLLEMRQNLYQSQKEDEKRKYEDDLRKWSNEGLTKFSEILRQSSSSISDLANNVIKNIIHFLDANQGGLFLYNDSDKKDIYLELVSSYAYNQERKKKKKIYPGEGLIGTCAIEKSYVYLTDLPSDYLTITSGLGGSNPGCLLIMPLKVEEQIFGVMEIASFKKMQIHEIEFVEKVSESIASQLSIAKINQRTAELLAQSQQQAEEMASQEEEMRQNLEELQATQEESARKEAEMQSILNAVNSSSLVIEYELTGRITSVNDAVCRTLNLQRDQLVGRNHDDFTESGSVSQEDSKFWNDVRDGEVVKRTDKIVASGENHWLHQVFTPILDSDGFPYKILNMATDITQSKQLEIELTEQTRKMSEQEEELRQNLEVLQTTQAAMTKQQDELNLANKRLQENEAVLVKAVEKSKEQEKELKDKVDELNRLHKELETQQAAILDQNRELQEKEQFQAKALEKADRNLERTRMKIMAEFVRNLERQMREMDAAELLLKKNKATVPPEVYNTFREVSSEFKVLISKYKFD